MTSFKKLKIFSTFLFLGLFLILTGCNGKLPGGDARKFPDDPKKRVEQNLKEGRGFKIMDMVKDEPGGVFNFASSNELWRASLDVIDFMPLTSANYSGGIIITDWYSEQNSNNESVKISIRFLTNEIRSDSVDIKIYNKRCSNNLINCEIIKTDGVLVTELKRKILKNAAILKETKEKEKKENKKN